MAKDNNKSQKGVSLIMTFFIMIIILAVVLSISLLLYSEVKVIRNVGDSMASLYTADSGIEKILYYDRQVVPEGATRGLCSMLTSCTPDLNPNNPDHSIYCNTPTISGADCGVATCANCTISFNTTFDDRIYYAIAKVYPEGEDSYFEIYSKGVFGSTQRQIKILIAPAE